MKSQPELEKKAVTEEDLLDANFLPADHQLLAKMQKTLENQLRKEEQKEKLELNQKTKLLDQLEKQKEEIGVQLYEQQQKLVELQKVLEEKHETHKLQLDVREKNEKTVRQLENQTREQQEEVLQLNSQLQRRIEELSKQNLATKEIEHFNQTLDSKIKEQRRVTYKIEENIVEAERAKNRQDFLIFSLMEEQKKFKEQKDFLEIQVKLQNQERQDAQGSLQQTQEEIDKIIQSKRALCGSL